MDRDVEAYRLELAKILCQLEPAIEAGEIVGDSIAQFLFVERGNRGVEIYCGNEAEVVVDPSEDEELLGEIKFPSFDHAIDAALRWLNGRDLDQHFIAGNTALS